MNRRTFLTGVAASLILAGCSQAPAADEHPTITIEKAHRCHMCGMVVHKHPGPKGAVTVKGQAQALTFCSTRDMFAFALQPQNQRQITYMVVHDVAKTDWENPSDDAFIPAEDAWYVYGSQRKAVMGPAVASLGSEADAKAFAEEFGGTVYRFDEITLALLQTNPAGMAMGGHKGHGHQGQDAHAGHGEHAHKH